MSASSKPAAIADLDSAAAAVLAAVEELVAAGTTADVSDETAQALLLAGIRLYAHKVDTENRVFPAAPPGAGLTATEVAVSMSELMREADLNMFDLAMWQGRARPAGDG